ncbi:1349_t:CDS:2 [Gigaspora rosea]|nr:1349_t:CDS:2 [Gigaspora rosea]
MAKFLLDLIPILPGRGQGSSLKLVISNMKKQWNFYETLVLIKKCRECSENPTSGRMSQYDADPKNSKSKCSFWLREIWSQWTDLPENHEFFIKIIEVHRIDIKQAKPIMSLNMICKLVEANIIQEHQNYTVSFHSRYIETYFKEAILTDYIAI